MSTIALAATWPPNAPLSSTGSVARGSVEYRGFEIDAGRLDDGTWVTTLDGDEISGTAPCWNDAIERGKSSVNRRIGRPDVERKSVAGDDAYFERLRAEIGGE